MPPSQVLQIPSLKLNTRDRLKLRQGHVVSMTDSFYNPQVLHKRKHRLNEKRDGGLETRKHWQTSADLTGVVIFRVEQVAELRQQLGPRLQLPFRGDGRDQDTCVGDSIMSTGSSENTSPFHLPFLATNYSVIYYASLKGEAIQYQSYIKTIFSTWWFKYGEDISNKKEAMVLRQRLQQTERWHEILFLFRHSRHTNCGTNEGRGVPNVAQTFLLDEVCHCWREVLVVSLYIVLQNQTT